MTRNEFIRIRYWKESFWDRWPQKKLKAAENRGEAQLVRHADSKNPHFELYLYSTRLTQENASTLTPRIPSR